MEKQVKTSHEIFEEMSTLWNVFVENHVRFHEKNVKAASVRSRKAALEIKKLAGNYRSTMLAEIRESK